MSYHQFIVEGKDPRPKGYYKPVMNYVQIAQQASFAHGFYTGAILGFRQKFSEVVETLEQISLREAKNKIKLYFEDHHGETVEYSDLLEQLRIPLPVIVEACNELEKEGKIAPID